MRKKVEKNWKTGKMSKILGEKGNIYEEIQKIRWKIQFNIEKIVFMHYGELD